MAAQAPRFSEPWLTSGTLNVQGTGFAIHGQRILTAAHVVARSTPIRVRRHGVAEKVSARVLFISRDADLAILTVDDPAFFEGLRPIEIGNHSKAPTSYHDWRCFAYTTAVLTSSLSLGWLGSQKRTSKKSDCKAGGFVDVV